MSLCSLCGQATLDASSLCTHHSSSYGDDWATSNRIMCDFVHRGISRMPAEHEGPLVELVVGAFEE